MAGDTLAVTADGPVALELLHKMAVAGDDLPDVLSFDAKQQRWVVRQINGAWVAGTTNRLLEVRTEAGLALRCTARHYLLTNEVGWAQGHELRPGVSLRGLSRERVDAVEPLFLADPVPVYDLEVEGTRNFAVTADGRAPARPVVVHNSGAGSSTRPVLDTERHPNYSPVIHNILCFNRSGVGRIHDM